MNVSELEAGIGIEIYASKSPGIGGKIRFLPEDFKVEEILTDGSKASLQPSASTNIDWGRYLLCVLVKKDWDTLIAVEKIAEHLGVDSECIDIAGIKDTKALTAQHVTISRVPPEKISTNNIKDMALKPLRFVDEKLSPRQLFGNSFQIAVRALEHDDLTLERRIADVMKETEAFGGVPNFFGHQRFGTTRPVTHLVGYCMVRRNFEDAVMTFLTKTSKYEKADSIEVRQNLNETHNFEAAFEKFPERLFYERLMLKHLAKHPKDFLGALHRVPLKLCRLFVQAYQSFLFNRSLSERVKQGIPLNEPQIGDYMVELDEQGVPTEHGSKVTDSNRSALRKMMEEKKTCIAIPLIGFKQTTSEGAQGQIERLILEKEHVSPEDFQIPQMREASSPGGLRPILTPVLNFHSKKPCEDPLNPDMRMVELEFTLHKSSYATVLLREVMKPENPVEAGF